MKPHLTFKQKIKHWLCRRIGHWLVYSHEYNNQHHYTCKLCGRLISKEIERDD